MDSDIKYGQTDLDMRDSGEMIRPMAQGNWCMQMETSMKGSGLMIKLMEKELMLMQMGLIIREIGLMISKKALEWNHGLMELSMKEDIKMERNMERVNLHLQMVVIMKVSSQAMKYVVEVNITGQMASFMMGNGLKIRCMV
jgi:hypothetical protein